MKRLSLILAAAIHVAYVADAAGIPLTNGNNGLWYGAINVGTPPKPFTVLFDTGSADLFLPGTDCDSSCDGHTQYDPSSSSTAQDLKKSFLINNGDGLTVSGKQFTDTVSIGGFTGTSQTLGAAMRYSSAFGISQFPADGILGMAFQKISKFDAPPIPQTLANQHQLEEYVFSFKLAASGSELYMGG
ncbi:hypothetical protein BGZ70_004013, partial [Mortierella alpina]